jgi:hypothetical protein
MRSAKMETAPPVLPPLEWGAEPLVCAPRARVVVGVRGVYTAGVAAKQEVTAALTSAAEVGDAEFTVALPAKSQL